MERDGTDTVRPVPAMGRHDFAPPVTVRAREWQGGQRYLSSRSRLFIALLFLVAMLVFAPLAYAASGPSNTSPPEISGEAVVGQTLTADPGEWSGDPEPTIAYQWQRCEQTPPSASFSGVTWPVSGFSGGIALDSSGDIFLASLDESFEGAVDKYGPTGSPIATYTDPSISGVWDVATDLAGNVYATNQFSETITKTTPAGVTSVFKSVPGNFGLAGIDVDSAGNVYVTSTLDEAYKVFKFGSDGTEVTTDGFPISFGAQELPQDVAVDSAGRIYVIVSNFMDEGLIARFLPNGTPDGEWGRPTSLGGGRFEGVFSISLDGADNLFVAESDRVVAFDPSMNYLTSWTGGAGGGGGTAFSGLRGIAVGADGAVYTSQLLGGSGGNEIMQKFTFSTGLTCQQISGANSSTHQVTPDDGGKRLRVTVTASNSEGSSEATSALTSAVRVSTLVVDDTGTPTGSTGQTGTCEAPNYGTIQAAVDAATAGDTVQVCEGEYVISSPVAVGKSLTINGAGKASTTVSTNWAAPSTNPAFLVNASNVTFTNMTVTNTNDQLSRGIQWATSGSGLTVTNVDFTDLVGNGTAFNTPTLAAIFVSANLADLDVSGSRFETATSTLGSFTLTSGIYGASGLNLSNWNVTGSTFKNIFMGLWIVSSIDGLRVTTSTFGPFDPSDASAGTSSIYIGDLGAGGVVKNIEVTGSTFTDFTRGLYIWNYASGGSIGSVKVTDNTFTNSIFSSAVRLVAGGLNGVKTPLEGPVEVDGNTIIQNKKIPNGQGIGTIDLRATTESATDSARVRNNTVTFTGPFDVTTVGAVIHGPLTNLTISGNTMDGNDAGGSFTNMPPTSGIWLLTNIAQAGPMSSNAKYSIANNVITGFGDGIAAFDWTTRTYGKIPTGAQVTVFENDLSGNTNAIHSGSPGATIDAVGNFWGSASGPDADDAIGPVTTSPWIASFTPGANPDSPSYTTGFWPDDIVEAQPCSSACYVNDATGSDSNPGTEGLPLKTIQKGIDHVSAGGRVIVAAGTYADEQTGDFTDIYVPPGKDGLTIEGAADQATPVVELDECQPTKTCASGSATNRQLAGVDVRSNDVTFEKLIFTKKTGAAWGPQSNFRIAANAGNPSGVKGLTLRDVTSSWSWGQNVQIQKGDTAQAVVIHSDLVFDGVSIENSGGRGLYIAPNDQVVDGFTFTDSTIATVGTNPAVSSDPGSKQGIQAAAPVEDVSITDSTFTGVPSGGINFLSGVTGASNLIEDVTVSGTTAADATQSGISVFNLRAGPGGGVTVAENITINRATVTDFAGRGILIAAADFGECAAGCEVDDVVVQNSTVTDPGDFSSGVMLWAFDFEDRLAKVTDVVVRNNEFDLTDTGDYGVYVEKFDGTVSGFDVTGNTFTGGIAAVATVDDVFGSITRNSLRPGPTGAPAVGVSENFRTEGELNATCNWWGQASGPAAGQTEGAVNTGAGSLRFLQSAGLDSPCLGSPQPAIDVATSFTTVGSLVSLVNAANWDIPQETGPLTLEYQWESCEFPVCEPGDWTAINGATNPTYRLTASDLGKRLRAVITASNPGPGGGSATYPAVDPFRNPFGPVVAPSSTALQPTPTGENVQVNFPALDNGQQVALDFGCGITESGTTTVTSRDESQVPGAEGFRFGDPPTAATIDTTAEYNCEGEQVISVCTTYDVESLPEGVEPRLFHFVDSPAPGSWEDVTVSWDPTTGLLCGGVKQFSPFAVGRAAVGPENEELPTISGTAEVGETLTASPGTWTGDEPIDYAYQWQRCDSDGTNCSDIGSATGQTYNLTAADSSKKVRVEVTASNDAGSAAAESALTAQVTQAPANTASPTVSGTAKVGQILTASPGTWSGFPAPTYAYRWQRADFGSGPWTDLPGSTGAAYQVGESDVDRFLRVVVEASNDAGAAEAESDALRVAPVVRGFGIKVEKLAEGPVRVPRNRTVRKARVTCVTGGCEIRKADVRIRVRKRLYDGRAIYPARTLSEGESAVVEVVVPRRAYRTLGRRGARMSSLYLNVTAEDGSKLNRAVRIGLRR